MGVVLGLGIALGILLIAAAHGSTSMHIRRPQLSKFKAVKRIDQEVWPDVVDNLASAIRAGLSLPQAVAEIAATGPQQVQSAFAQCSSVYQQTGNFGDALLGLRQEFADSSTDKICSALQIAYEVGGADLGLVLRSLSEVLREDARVRSEITARQSWTVNGAKLAVAAPWLTALVLSTRSGTAAVYFSASGIRMLSFCAVVSVLAYLTMMRIGRLPSQPRLMS
jgi:tight adherence protein B